MYLIRLEKASNVAHDLFSDYNYFENSPKLKGRCHFQHENQYSG